MDAREWEVLTSGFPPGLATGGCKAVTGIDHEAEALLDRLDGRKEGETQKRPMLFIAHSLGGLIVKKLIILGWENSDEYGNLLESIQGLVFLGVPHRGADLAYWTSFPAKLLKYSIGGAGANTAYVDALKSNSQTWRDISKQFVKRTVALQIRTFYETERYLNLLLVDEDSSRLNLPNERAVGVAGSNHISMCKFEHGSSQRYEPVWKAVKKLAQDAVGGSDVDSISLSAEELQCFQSLYTSDYIRHRARNPPHVPGTCEWILRHAQYQQWLQTPTSNLLWLSADPGCGKSVLASFLVEELRSPHSQARLSSQVCFFFFKDDDDEQRVATAALCAILHQLVDQLLRRSIRHAKDVLGHVVSEFRSRGQRVTEDFGALWASLTSASLDERCGNIICVLDGLDECEDSSRTLLIRSLVLFYSSNERARDKSVIKFLITSRPFRSIEDQFHQLSIIRLKGEDETRLTSADVDLVVRSRVQVLGDKRCLPLTVQAALAERLIRNADRTFLWVSLVLADLEKNARASKGALENLIDTIPETLGLVYDKILAQSFNLTQTRKVLHLILGAARPFSLDEMNVAFVIRAGDRSHDDLDLEPAIGETIRYLCGLFVRVIDRMVYLVHQTARDYLLKPIDEEHTSPLRWKYSVDPVVSHGILAQVCIWYLSFAVFEADPLVVGLEHDHHQIARRVDRYTSQYVFLDYAAKNWAVHLLRAENRTQSDLTGLALAISKPETNRCRTWFEVYWRTVSMYTRFRSDLTPLMLASHFGLETLARRLLEDGADVTAKTSDGWTALHAAAKSGSEVLMKLLLEKGAQVEAKDRYDQTALHQALYGGHLKGVFLLEKGTSSPPTPNLGWTALRRAAYDGNVTELLRLLSNDGDVVRNEEVHLAAGKNDRDVALRAAAHRGHEGVVRLLLENGADVCAHDGRGRTALRSAALKGHFAIVRLLLDKGPNISANVTHGLPVLVAAIALGHEAIAKLLLERGADTTARDPKGWTALVTAAYFGSETMVRLLLRYDANVEARMNGGRTALTMATTTGHYEGIILLLDAGADVNAYDNDGFTALHWSALRGREAIVRLLLERGGDVFARCNRGNTALWVAVTWPQGPAISTQVGVVHVLLEHGADVLASNNEGETVLHGAAYGGHLALTWLLLERGANVMAKTRNGITPLLRAALRGHRAVVHLLLEHGADARAAKDDGTTALHHAALQGHKDVVGLLLERDADVHAKDSVGRTALLFGALNGHGPVMQLLVKHRADIETTDINGLAALHLATMRGHEVAVGFLLEQGANANSEDDRGNSVLHWAAVGGHLEVLQQLIEAGAILGRPNQVGLTELHVAALNGHEAVTRLLLTKCVDVNTRNMVSELAVRRGHDSIVRLFSEDT